MMCEWCWSQAFRREHADTSKSQGEHYRDILHEQEVLGENAACPHAKRRSAPPPNASSPPSVGQETP